MDSLTQIVLGAAAGEIVLGRKLGNRAMIWGAIGGTIPDLDVFVPGLTDIQALTVHRGITHSFLFSILAPLLFAYLAQLYYKYNFDKKKGVRIGGNIVLSVLLTTVLFLLVQLLSICAEIINWTALVGALAVFGVYLYRIWKKKESEDPPEVSFVSWYLLFFLAFVTHILLDACTSYGTQLFLPFSEYRVAFNNVAVADPFYTVPFLLLIIATSFIKKNNVWRSRMNYLAILVSSLYLVYTFSNKKQAQTEFVNALAKENIEYSRPKVFPTILNNWLWHCVAEGDTVFYQTSNSLLSDKDRNEIRSIPKNHHLIKDIEDEKDFKVLTWFSNDYYSILVSPESILQYNDLRFGTINDEYDDVGDFIFSFTIGSDENGELELTEKFDSEESGDLCETYHNLKKKIKGEN